MTEQELSRRIEDAIRDIPANNPSYISVRQETLINLMSRSLIQKIAQVAAAVAIRGDCEDHSR